MALDEDTKVIGKPGEESTVADLSVGQTVVVSGLEGEAAQTVMVENIPEGRASASACRRPDCTGDPRPPGYPFPMEEDKGRDVRVEAGIDPEDPWRLNEVVRRRRLREDGRRPLAVNLAEGLALTEFLSTFTGSARDS